MSGVADEAPPWGFVRRQSQEERERYLDGVVKMMLQQARNNPKFDPSLFLGFLALLLRTGDLPPSGRDYLAASLAKISDGRSPSVLMPRKRKRKAYKGEQILGAVERGKDAARPGTRRPVDLRSRRPQFGIKGSTAAKEASTALSALRRWASSIHARDGSTSSTDERIVGAAARRMKLPEAKVRDLLFGPLFEK